MKSFFLRTFKKLTNLELYQRILNHDVISYSAQSAYYLMLAIFPFLILILMLLTLLGLDHLDETEKILSFLPREITPVIKEYLNYSKELSTSVFSPLLISSVIISSGAITSFAKAFNIANDIKEGRPFLKQFFLSAFFLVSLVGIFTLSLFLSVLGLELINEIFRRFGIEGISGSTFKWTIFFINVLISFLIISLMYYVLPAKKTGLKQSLPGAFFATSGIALITNLFGFFVHNFTRYSMVYGSLSSVIMLLIWLFFCSFILIVGEEINVIYQRKTRRTYPR